MPFQHRATVGGTAGGNITLGKRAIDRIDLPATREADFIPGSGRAATSRMRRALAFADVIRIGLPIRPGRIAAQ